MRKQKFTKPSVKALQPESKRYDVHDDSDTPGLVVTVQPSGLRTWYLVRRVGHRVERIRIGRADVLDPERARKKAAKLNGEIADGRSPSAERRAIRAEMELGALWEQFKKRHGPRKRSFYTDESRWKTHLADWQGRKLSSITRTDVNGLLEKIAGDSPVTANRVRTLLGTMYSKAREWGAEVENPVAGTRRNRETSKTRYLSPDELRRFLEAVDEDYDADTRDSLKLLLLTGVRCGSLSAGRWQDLALPDALWRIPPEYMKAGRALELPLAPAAVAILNERARRAEGSPWVFPGGSGGHIASPARSGWLRVLKRAGITDLQRHDLRRTYATYALEAGVALPLIAAVLGHTMPGGVVTVYARPTPAQVREGVERTVEHLLRVAEVAAAKAKEGAVVAFPTRRAK
jgi:integrase